LFSYYFFLLRRKKKRIVAKIQQMSTLLDLDQLTATKKPCIARLFLKHKNA